MPWVELEPTIPASEGAKTVHALDHAATVTGTKWLFIWEIATKIQHTIAHSNLTKCCQQIYVTKEYYKRRELRAHRSCLLISPFLLPLSTPVRRAFGNVSPEEILLTLHTILLEVHLRPSHAGESALQFQKLFPVSTDLKSRRSLCDIQYTVLAGRPRNALKPCDSLWNFTYIKLQYSICNFSKYTIKIN
jgi:hypothetical protein